MQPLPELRWQFVRLIIFIERDRLANIIHHDPARVAAVQMLHKFVADRRINRAVHVFAEHCQHFVAFHIGWYSSVESWDKK